MMKARDFPFLVAKKIIIKAINEGNGELALKVLKSRQRELYFEKQHADITSKGEAVGTVDAIITAIEAARKTSPKNP